MNKLFVIGTHNDNQTRAMFKVIVRMEGKIPKCRRYDRVTRKELEADLEKGDVVVVVDMKQFYITSTGFVAKKGTEAVDFSVELLVSCKSHVIITSDLFTPYWSVWRSKEYASGTVFELDENGNLFKVSA